MFLQVRLETIGKCCPARFKIFVKLFTGGVQLTFQALATRMHRIHKISRIAFIHMTHVHTQKSAQNQRKIPQK